MDSTAWNSDAACPPTVHEFAEQAVRYVQTALQVQLAYDSDTLPVMDHYLRSVPESQAAMVALVISTSGAYFGEVVRRRLGGHWDLSAGEPTDWRLILPGGVSFAPAGVVASVIVRHDELEDLDPNFDVPLRLRAIVEATLARMSQVTEDEYYSLCGRLDTLEHLQDVLIGVQAIQQPSESGGFSPGSDD